MSTEDERAQDELTEQPGAAPGTASHDPAVPPALIAHMTRDWAPPAPIDATPAAFATFTAARRAALSAAFPGEWLVVPSGNLKVRANDTHYAYRPGTELYWLTGSQEPDVVLVFAPSADGGHDVTLYTAPRMDRSTPAFFTDRTYGELWVGPRPDLAEVEATLGITAAPLDELERALKAIEDAPVRVLRDNDGRVDALVAPVAWEAPADDEAAVHPDAELGRVLAELRLVKDQHEVVLLQQAVDATIRGFEDAVRELPTALVTSERWIEGTFWRRARTEGNDVGYGSIVACGAHACTLHWTRNDGAVRLGDLALLDMGVESVELYTADVTRTIPISGRFSPAQREVYEVVLAAQQAGIAECRPGRPFLAPHDAAMRVITGWLVERGILTCSVEEALDPEHLFHRRYTLHGTSHMLGLDVHDCAQARNEKYRKADLEPGICLTVEPGLYFQPDDLTVPEGLRGIGVRIEDDILVTADGHRNLSAALPTDPDELEAWMAGLLPAGWPQVR